MDLVVAVKECNAIANVAQNGEHLTCTIFLLQVVDPLICNINFQVEIAELHINKIIRRTRQLPGP